jgi:hypothetical protein
MVGERHSSVHRVKVAYIKIGLVEMKTVFNLNQQLYDIDFNASAFSLDKTFPGHSVL